MTAFCRKNSIFCRTLAVAALFVLLIFCVLPSFAVATSGKTEGIKWSVDGTILTVSGKGNMPDFTEQSPAPWSAYAGSVTHLSLDSDLTSIGSLAFYEFKSLVSVSLSKNVKTIGNMAFAGCESLNSLYLSQVSAIGEYAFSRCFNLESVVLPTTVTILGANAFYRCESLYTISVPQSVTEMGGSVFAYCKSLVSANIYANIKTLPEWTFYGCESLSSMYFSDTITAVGDKALEGCDVLIHIYHQGGEEVTEQLKPELPTTQDGFVRVDVESNVETPPPSTSTSVTRQDDEYVRTDSVVESTPDSVIKTETTTYHTATENGYDEKKNDAEIKINAVISNDNGWNELVTRLETEYANRGALEGVTNTDVEIDVDVSILDGSYIYGKTLEKLKNKRVSVTVTTPKGSSWTIDGKQLSGYKFKTKYNLEYTLSPYSKLSAAHKLALSGAVSYKIATSDKIDFPITLRLYLDKSLTNSNATLYDNGFGGTLKEIKIVKLKDGFCEYKLANVNKGERYVVAINTQSATPDRIEYPDLENYVPVTEQYEITEVRGFMGMTMKQFTMTLGIGLAVLAFVVFIIILILNLTAKKKALDAVRNKKAEE